MIHEVQDKHLELDLSEYDVITFDDGLYSQYFHYKHFLKYNVPLIFFISTNIVCDEDTCQNEEFTNCNISHKEHFLYGVKHDYMKWSQIHEINKEDNCFIGGHSHEHKEVDSNNVRTLYTHIIHDTMMMMTEFKNQGISLDKFCYPYNRQYSMYKTILKDNDITSFYGNERIDIDDLFENKGIK